MAVRRRPGSTRLTLTGRDGDLVGIDTGELLQRRLGHGIGTPIGARRLGRRGGDEDRPAGGRGAQQRIEAADEAPIRRQIDVDDLLPFLGIDMAEGREGPQHGGIGDQDVEALVALIDRRAQPVEGGEIRDVEGNQRRMAADGLHRIVDFLQPADGAGQQDQLGALFGEALGDGRAQAARSTGHERDAPGEPSFGHGLRRSRRGGRAAPARRRPGRSAGSDNRR